MTKRLTAERKKQLSEFYNANALTGHNPIKELIDEIDALEKDNLQVSLAYRGTNEDRVQQAKEIETLRACLAAAHFAQRELKAELNTAYAIEKEPSRHSLNNVGLASPCENPDCATCRTTRDLLALSKKVK